MKTLETIYNKLNSVEKTELETHKVELGIAEDISKLEAAISAGTTKLKAHEKEIESFAKELAAKYKQGDKIETVVKKDVSKYEKLEDKAYKLMDKAESAAKELGVNPNEIKGFKELSSLVGDLESLTGELPVLINQMYV